MLKKVSILKAYFPPPEFGREILFEGMNVIVRRMFPINLFEFSVVCYQAQYKKLKI